MHKCLKEGFIKRSISILFNFFFVASVASIVACASSPSTLPPPVIIYEPVESEQANPEAQAVKCEPEKLVVDIKANDALKQLAMGNQWHKEYDFTAAFEAYENVLSQRASFLTDAYALWGLVTLYLDRANPDYSRDKAEDAVYVLEKRIQSALSGDGAAEAEVLWFSAQAMIKADRGKDRVVDENQRLRKELAQRDEAIQRLREVTVGR